MNSKTSITGTKRAPKGGKRRGERARYYHLVETPSCYLFEPPDHLKVLQGPYVPPVTPTAVSSNAVSIIESGRSCGLATLVVGLVKNRVRR